MKSEALPRDACAEDGQPDIEATVAHMIKLHGTKRAYQRANDHACSYPSWSWQYRYWLAVGATMLRKEWEADGFIAEANALTEQIEKLRK
jgi:hypothetical protein